MLNDVGRTLTSVFVGDVGHIDELSRETASFVLLKFILKSLAQR